MTQFNENALKLAPWSATKRKTATKCPFRAYHAFVNKSPELFNTIMDDSPKIVGIKMHTFMELVLSKFPKDQFPHDKELQLFGQRILQVILKDEDMTYKETDAIKSMYDGALNTCQRFLSHRLKSNGLTFVEIPVGIDKEFQPIDFFAKDVFFRGKIDYTMLSQSGAVALMDHKTGQWPNLKGHQLQLRTYEVLAFHALKKKFKDDYNIELSSFISGLAFIAEENVLWDKVKPAKQVEGSGTQNFINDLNELSNKVFEKEIKRGKHCNYCGFKHLCGSRVGQNKKKTQVLM